jgi:hypothetical protein
VDAREERKLVQLNLLLVDAEFVLELAPRCKPDA